EVSSFDGSNNKYFLNNKLFNPIRVAAQSSSKTKHSVVFALTPLRLITIASSPLACFVIRINSTDAHFSSSAAIAAVLTAKKLTRILVKRYLIKLQIFHIVRLPI